MAYFLFLIFFKTSSFFVRSTRSGYNKQPATRQLRRALGALSSRDRRDSRRPRPFIGAEGRARWRLFHLKHFLRLQDDAPARSTRSGYHKQRATRQLRRAFGALFFFYDLRLRDDEPAATRPRCSVFVRSMTRQRRRSGDDAMAMTRRRCDDDATVTTLTRRRCDDDATVMTHLPSLATLPQRAPPVHRGRRECKVAVIPPCGSSLLSRSGYQT